MKEEDGDASSHIFGQFRQSLTIDPLQGLEGVWGRWLGGGASDDCVSGVQCDVRCQVIAFRQEFIFGERG